MGHLIKDRAPLGRQPWIALLILALGGFALLGYVLWSAYEETWAEARLRASSHADLLEARFDSSLRRIDADLYELANDVPDEAMFERAIPQFQGSVEASMERYGLVFPEVVGFQIANAEGNILYQTGSDATVNVADRGYFRTMRDIEERGIVFSEVFTSPVTGRSTLVAVRRIEGKNSRFLGVVSAAIDLGYFDQMNRLLPLGPSGVLAIRRADSHTLVMRSPSVSSEINRPLEASHPIYQRMLAGERQGILDFVAQTDGIKRTYAYRTLSRYPFYVLAGLSEADMLAVWRHRAGVVGSLGFALFSCLGLVIVWLFRAQKRELLAAEELRRNREQLREAQRLAQVGSWELDLSSQRLVWSEALYQLFEFDHATVEPDYDLFLDRVHPEDRATLDNTYRKSVEDRQPYEIEHRLLMPDGRVKFVRECGETFYAPDGIPLRSIGTAQDITSQRQMESKMQLLASAFQHSGEAILITDSQNHIITVNPAFTSLTGYPSEEALGRNPRFLSAGRTTPEEYQRMWAQIAERGFWQGEIWDRRKDGGIYPKWMSVSVIRDDDGKVRYHVAHFTDISSEREVEAKLHHIAHHDVLTGLLNRFSLKGRLDQALAAARRGGSRVALLFIDLDRFKAVNDTLGHHVGDLLLVEVARRLRESVRDSDVVARLGGDEFVVMLAGIEHTSAVAMVAEKLVLSVGDPYIIGGHDIYTTPSLGIAIFPTDGDDGDSLMKNADAAMYHAKAAGRNNFQFFDAKMNDAALERLKIEHNLRQALSRDEFCLHFQPVIEMASGRVAAVEALVRWQHPEKGLIPPGKFIPIAEETGLIQPLGEWVFWTACRQLAAFRAEGIFGVAVCVNISAIQMRNGNLPVLAKGALEAFDLDPGGLIFEITESVAMEQPEETVRVLDLLHDMGIGLAIDDFGTGYSSLSYLRMFPIHHLKLDRSFVEEIGIDEDSSVICDATIGLAHNLGLSVVAEGVETQQQLDYLRARGCDLAQGYLISRPVPAGEVMAFIRQHNG